ncbi:MAG: hypothetical protein Ct9H300mP7_4880 [Verrucomicrobiota bacterium]|nr:MAG: hypothetical protein Ct9H300mP7_4880 [Verrucomicrobiota bacterium]
MQINTAWHVPRGLDLDRMRRGAGYFVGKRDFRAFAVKREYEMRSTIRTVTVVKYKKRFAADLGHRRRWFSRTRCAGHRRDVG